MNWTEDKPTKEGWYWFRMDNEEKRIVIVYVITPDRMVAIGDDMKVTQHFRRVPGMGQLSLLRLKNGSHSGDVSTYTKGSNSMQRAEAFRCLTALPVNRAVLPTDTRRLQEHPPE
jgi:hypothetical protein